MSFLRTVAAASVALFASTMGSSAFAYSQVIAFGDSLSDNGNLATIFNGSLPAAPYVGGRFSNGPVAVEVMAAKLGAPLVDYALGGALTNTDNQFAADNPLAANTGIMSQIANFTGALAAQNKTADADALYFVWGGGNDFLAVINGGDNAGSIGSVIKSGVANLVTDVTQLYNAGARNILVPLLPDLGTTYYGTSGSVSASLLTQVTTAFNSSLSTKLQALQGSSPGMKLTVFDSPAFLVGVRQSIADNGGNILDRCWSGDYTGANNTEPLCADPSKYFLWDKVHPTSPVYQLIGTAMANSVDTGVVPEPASSGLMLLGLALMGVALRSRHRQA